jgi:hypothetical protein
MHYNLFVKKIQIFILQILEYQLKFLFYLKKSQRKIKNFKILIKLYINNPKKLLKIDILIGYLNNKYKLKILIILI